MNETQDEDDKPEIFRYIMTVGGELHAKLATAALVAETWREVAGVTNEEIEVYSIH